MATAYEEALARVQSGQDITGASIPSYITAADTLSIANGNKTFLESAADTLESIPKFIGVSLISGANQLYNTPADIGNLFGGNFERSDTSELISSLDSNLGAFYGEHQEGADLVGFMVSSLIPGLGGIKILNAGQKSLSTAINAGKFGNNTARALGLLVPSKSANLTKALKEVATNSSAASLLNRNALKAVGAGIGQNALEALAFETAVTATLFKSPILENQDFGDFVTNVAFGAGVFGFVGGAVDAAKISFSLKRAADKAAIEARPWQFIAEPAAASKGYERVVLDFEQINAIPPVPAGMEVSRKTFLEQASATKVTKLEGRIRKELGELSGGDQDVAETLFQGFKTSSLADQQSAFIGLVETTKLGATSKIAARSEKLSAKVLAGKASFEEIEAFAEDATVVAYTKAWGEDAGRVMSETPVATSLVDTLKKGQIIKVSATGVKAGAKKFPFNTRFNIGKKAGLAKSGVWNILKSDPLEAQARYIWAQKLPKFEPTASKPITVHVDDLPLMEKVFTEVSPEDLVHVKFAGLAEGEFLGDSLREFIGNKKVQLANRLLAVKGEVNVAGEAALKAAQTKLAKAQAAQSEEAGSRLSAEIKRTNERKALEASLKEQSNVVRLNDRNNITKLKSGLDNHDLTIISGLEGLVDTATHRLLIAQASKLPRDIVAAKEIISEAFDEVGMFASLLSPKGEGAKNFIFDKIAAIKLDIDAIPTIQVVTDKATSTILPSKLKSLAGATKSAQAEIEAAELAISKFTVSAGTQEQIAAMVNVKSSFLSGEVVRDSVSTYSLKDILAMQDHAESYTANLIAQGARKAKDGVVDIWNVPQHIKLTYDTSPFAGINNHVVENMAIIKEQQKLYQEGTSRASANVLGEDFAKLEDINSGRVFEGAVPSGAGAGFVSAASSNYGTLAATVENIGSVTSRLIEKFKDRSREALEPLLYKLGNNQQASIEWSTLNQRVRAIEGEYGLNELGDALEPLVLLRWKKMAQEAQEAGTPVPKQPVLTNPAMELRIELQSKEVRDLARAHIEINGDRTAGLAGIRTAQGLQFNRAPDAFYPIPIDPREFPHFAIVIDESITSGNHSKTLFASSTEELSGMIKKLKENPHLTVLTKNEAEAYHRSRGTWDYEKTMNNNYLDTEAHRKGVSAPFLVATDPQKITTDMLGWHLQRETGLVREAVAAKYEVQFEELRRLGEEFTDVATSRFSDMNLLKFADDAVKNPFADYIKTALGIRKTADYPWWVNPNRMADAAVSSLLKRATAVVESARTPEQLAEVNKMLTKAGYKGAAYDESMEIFANAEPAKGALSAVVQKANSILATVVLRWDMLNAVNNAVSANVLLGAETKAVVRAINRGDAEAVGALSKLMDIKVPGTEELIKAPSKLIANAIRRFNRQGDDFKFYKDNGYVTSISDQYRSALDSLTFTGKESVKNWDSRIDKLHTNLRDLADAGEKWTGNKLAEEFNRFVAADVMKQMTDVAVSRNLMTSKEQLAYINTFVNRTQGNYLASQRPMMFQGPVGQAIGLFQTYQFNLLQQMLRHVGEGHAKDSMVLLGLQGTIHGMNGLPAFNALNTHLVGTASGNTQHRDAYDAVYGIAGKEAGDWLMYGAASNVMGLLHPDLKINLYTRGDINPRHVTIVPTDPASIPAIQASAKVFANIFNTAKKLAQGGDITTTLLQGLEHNGISRPLAGLAQTLQGINNPLQASYSTSKRGNVIAANDMLSWANLGRLVGGKPLDEAIAIDATYRFKAYALVDSKRRQTLGQAIKSTIIAGQNPTQEQIEGFAESYAAGGGRQEEFNRWFTQLYKVANLSQSNEIQQSLRSPFTQSMQRIMGGEELRDFTNE